MSTVQIKMTARVKNAAFMSALVLLFTILLTACAAPTAEVAPTPEPVEPTVTVFIEPSATASATLEPTLTPTNAPSATPLPSETPLAPLAVLPEGFNIWCNPMDYAGMYQPAAQAPAVARQLGEVLGQQHVYIPDEFCVAVYTFNQPVPPGASLWIYDAQDRPFFKAELTADGANPAVGYAAFDQEIIMNPPFWQVTYPLAAVTAEGQELRKDSVVFGKVIPAECPYGGLPDPVTLYCAITDPWEVEPHPTVVYPYKTHTPSPD